MHWLDKLTPPWISSQLPVVSKRPEPKVLPVLPTTAGCMIDYFCWYALFAALASYQRRLELFLAASSTAAYMLASKPWTAKLKATLLLVTSLASSIGYYPAVTNAATTLQ